MALHHLPTESYPHVPWPSRLREPRIFPRQHVWPEQDLAPRTHAEILERIHVQKSEQANGQRFLHVTVPPEAFETPNRQQEKCSVWVGYATQEFLDAPPVYQTSVTRELSVSDQPGPESFRLPLTCSLTKPVTVQISLRSGRQELSRYRIEDDEILPAEKQLHSEKKARLSVLR